VNASPIPDHVLQQAKDAVSHPHTQAYIRLCRGDNFAAPDFSGPPENRPDKPAGPIADDVLRQAKDAVAHYTTTAQIRLVKDNGSIYPPHTPSPKTAALAERIAEMHKSGQDMDSVQRDISKDNFGR
jgi:hypothetical protein